ncbi:MAG: hypothetical protein MSH64_14790 [Bacteroides uniformis]|uniref:hypothetical protein n=1 Tax=Bacteroides uniformis TaxID=820 RepID=UPI001C038888|nr:hypothetical protein [Bacteroides uniformis]MBT9923233.1 hypothetical protein [Bacteroides uniformis]MCI7387900.1 hypothetical protein [Bacteroides uniformis]
MKKKLIIDKCISCPYFQQVLIEGVLRIVCFGRSQIHYLKNDTTKSIPDDCPLEDAQ